MGDSLKSMTVCINKKISLPCLVAAKFICLLIALFRLCCCLLHLVVTQLLVTRFISFLASRWEFTSSAFFSHLLD
jgi:hypothetical protein